VGLGHVGIVLALEVSRFARSSADWHRLLDLCALTATLIADADGLYSPADFNDRLLLALKGTMSEAELHLIRARLDGGLLNKAKRGELRLALPVGLDRDEHDRIVLCPDEEVRHAILRVFALWRQTGLRAPSRDGADRRRSEAAAPNGRRAPHPLGAPELWRRARLPHQPRVRGDVRVRQEASREAHRRRRPDPHQDDRAARRAVVCLPDRAPSRICVLG
jgi:hypothetical protein